MDDRARTLELAFDRALRSKNWAQGTNFYSRWSPSESVPALFFNTTSANYGTPIVISQLYMADPEKEALAAGLQASVSSFAGNDKRKNAAQLLIEGIGANEYTRPAYFNILQYRPDLQLPLSTAATLSARFPYVTPPGVLYGDMEHKAIDTTLRETKSLQLIDGGFWDNSGIGTAVEIIRRVKAESSIKELVSDVECHLISFSHARRALLKTGTRDAQSELITPVMTFEAVRQARRLRVSDAEAAGFKVHDYELFDYAFQAPLSWTLSKRMRVQIEARSGGDVQPFLCCEVTIPFLFHFLDLPGLVLDVELSDDQIYLLTSTDTIFGACKIRQGNIRDGLRLIEEAILRREKEGFRALADLSRLNLAEIYLQFIARNEKPPLPTLLRNLPTLLRNLPILVRVMMTAHSRIPDLLKQVMANPHFDPAGHHIGRAQMILGQFYKVKKKRALALEHLTEAKRILSQFGQTPILARVDTALAELKQ